MKRFGGKGLFRMIPVEHVLSCWVVICQNEEILRKGIVPNDTGWTCSLLLGSYMPKWRDLEERDCSKWYRFNMFSLQCWVVICQNEEIWRKGIVPNDTGWTCSLLLGSYMPKWRDLEERDCSEWYRLNMFSLAAGVVICQNEEICRKRIVPNDTGWTCSLLLGSYMPKWRDFEERDCSEGYRLNMFSLAG